MHTALQVVVVVVVVVKKIINKPVPYATQACKQS